MKLNPGFAPAYDALAMYYSRDAAKANEAHRLNIQAISLEPDNLNYRLNAAAVLMNEHQYTDAIAVLKAAFRVAKTPEQVVSVQTRIDQIEQYNAAVERNRQAEEAAGPQTVSTIVTDTRTMTMTSSDGRKVILRSDAAQQTPKYPTEAPTGPHHTARGILRSVHCSYPTILTLSVDQAGKAVSLYRNDFNQIEFSATNFTPQRRSQSLYGYRRHESQGWIRRSFRQIHCRPDPLRRAEQIVEIRRHHSVSIVGA